MATIKIGKVERGGNPFDAHDYHDHDSHDEDEHGGGVERPRGRSMSITHTQSNGINLSPGSASSTHQLDHADAISRRHVGGGGGLGQFGASWERDSNDFGGRGAAAVDDPSSWVEDVVRNRSIQRGWSDGPVGERSLI